MATRNELKRKILNILHDIPETRNCDVLLTTEIWKRYNPKCLKFRQEDSRIYIAIDDLQKIPREDHVKRIRAKIQNDKKRPLHLRYLPTREEVAKQRKLNMAEWYVWSKSNS